DKQDVIATIKNLHKRGFAEAGEWSKAIAIPSPNAHDSLPTMPPGSVMSILTKYLHQDEGNG
ncbi:hypothetical protein IQ268_04195, partial [Oculatella sp. LEGE 06141]|uniref:hypothetical protein n=1 Tax=Oculatella sp. LEGE 06141 TaxID=1828648 RepID=UPI0019E573A4